MYWKYFKYVIKHKWFIFLACYKMGVIWRGITHDLSKFRPSEFIPYARYFYGSYPKFYQGIITTYPHILYEDVEKAFDQAWLIHIHRNPHHWQYWLLQQEDDGTIKRLKIPLKYLKEMICDWIGAGKAITGKNDIKDWYEKNKEKILLTPVDKKWVEDFIEDKNY